MSFVPRYQIPAGTKVTRYDQVLILKNMVSDGYEFIDEETGVQSFISYLKFATLLKSPTFQVGSTPGELASVVTRRTKGLNFAECLSPDQQAMGRFHFAICRAIKILEPEINLKPGKPLTAAALDNPKVRERLCRLSSDIFGEKIVSQPPAGGKRKWWILYRGRTLKKYLSIYESVDTNDDPIAALATLDNLKGNETRRITVRHLQLMSQAWEEVGLDLKAASPSNVLDRLRDIIGLENQKRKLNDLAPLIVPSQTTVTRHRNQMLSPVEYSVATKGYNHTRSKHGRGSSDVRALCLGELVEIDEYKMSLVASAKDEGYWQSLSTDYRETLEAIDELIARRYYLLVMIDVASRFPLAWVLSDAPKAEATMELLRMATRDKTYEKNLYGCVNDPAPAMGLGMIKNDNGTGLRNATVKAGALGVGASITDVRTSAPTDKCYVERLFGSFESQVLKTFDGYTGRRPGDLPEYDSIENATLLRNELYRIITRYFIDEYPLQRHYGLGVFNKRPIELFREINETRGIFKVADPDQRRIHLGHKVKVTPTDEGVCVFGCIWFSSLQFQKAMDRWKRTKVSVYVDPNDLNHATILVPGEAQPFRVDLQTSFFADMSLLEVMTLLERYRYEHPRQTEIYEDQLAALRRDRYDELKRLELERNADPSSFSLEAIKRKADFVLRGARVNFTSSLPFTTSPDDLMSVTGDVKAVKLDDFIEGECSHQELIDETLQHAQMISPQDHQGHSGRGVSLADDNFKEEDFEDDEDIEDDEGEDEKPLARPTNGGQLK
ncbi:hypothetical protein B9057_06070 [Aestuarium zhoushanense]|nr:hypothetical protein B9057_02545 [Aestuarium zhoushanense]AUJ63904.1 hypothetical protein B9057_06070 [Aestuarium zhoushanense]